MIVPSRGRPGNIVRLIMAMREHNRGDTTLLVGLDADDPTLDEYLALDFPEVQLDIQSGLRRVVPWLNHLALRHVDEYRFIGHFGDDNTITTVGWDARVIDTLDAMGGVGFCFGRDLYPGRPDGSLCCHIFQTSEVTRRLGYFALPTVAHMYCDPCWLAWGSATQIKYLHDVVLPHLHYSAGLSEQDESYSESTACIPADLEAFNAYCDDGSLNADIRKLGGREFSPMELHEFKVGLNIPQHWGEPVG